MKPLLVVAALLMPLAATAEEPQHLLPEDGFFGSPRMGYVYDALIRKHFFGRGSSDSRHFIELVIVPSFQPEEVISLDGNDLTSARLVHVTAKRSIWTALCETDKSCGDGDSPDAVALIEKVSVPTERHEAALDEALKSRLVRVWTALLRMTHYGARSSIGEDGTSYHFSAFILHEGRLYGRTWSPSPNSLPGLFVELGTLLCEFADGSDAGRPAIHKKIEKFVARLEQRLGR